MKTDVQLKSDVERELAWNPAIHPALVGVAVSNGIVTLSGHIDTYAEKFAVEKAVKNVAGVKGVAMELDVKLAPDHHRSDTDIALAAQTALLWDALVPHERIKVKAEKGWLTLEGQVEWDYQREAAARSVRNLTGVVGVSNLLTLAPKATPTDVRHRIQDALVRHAEREAKHIEVSVSGGTVTLSGNVDSWAERASAQGAAWSAPGVTHVNNGLRVGA